MTVNNAKALVEAFASGEELIRMYCTNRKMKYEYVTKTLKIQPMICRRDFVYSG